MVIFVENDSVSREDLETNRVDPFGPFQLQEDNISGSECKNAYGFNSKIYITVEIN